MCRSDLSIFPNEQYVSDERSVWFFFRCTVCIASASYSQQTCLNELPVPLAYRPFCSVVLSILKGDLKCRNRPARCGCFCHCFIWTVNNSERTALERRLPPSRSMYRYGDRRRKPFGKETTSIPEQNHSVWRRPAIHTDSGGLSTVPPTILRRLISRIGRARRKDCGERSSWRRTLKYGAEAAWGSLGRKGANPFF